MGNSPLLATVGRVLIIFSAIALTPRAAWAGMPSVSFTEAATLRLEVISFFLVGLLLSAGAVQLIWNLMRRDFGWLPQLNYWRALGVVTLWGLLFVVVLTMISGARELMTPGAWVKTGATYKLKEVETAKAKSSPDSNGELVARSFQILSLSNALQNFAAQNEGRLPTDEEAEQVIPAVRWYLAGFPDSKFIYVAASAGSRPSRIVAYEPQLYTGHTLAITADGQLVQLPFEQLVARVRSEKNAQDKTPTERAADVAAEATP